MQFFDILGSGLLFLCHPVYAVRLGWRLDLALVCCGHWTTPSVAAERQTWHRLPRRHWHQHHSVTTTSFSVQWCVQPCSLYTKHSAIQSPCTTPHGHAFTVTTTFLINYRFSRFFRLSVVPVKWLLHYWSLR